MIVRYSSVENAPKPVGPYSVAVEWNGLIFLSGVIPLKCVDGEQVVVGEFKEQADCVFKNLLSVLQGLTLRKENVLKVTVYLTDLSNFAIFNQLFESFFNEHLPARTTVQVSALPKGALVELDCVCVKT